MTVRALIALAWLCFGASGVWAQIAVEGGVRGLVTDAQGGVLPGVTLTATSPTAATPVTVTTDTAGELSLPVASTGRLHAHGRALGVREIRPPRCRGRAGRNIALDITMTVGSLEETVEVTVESPLLEVQKATTSVNITASSSVCFHSRHASSSPISTR